MPFFGACDPFLSWWPLAKCMLAYFNLFLFFTHNAVDINETQAWCQQPSHAVWDALGPELNMAQAARRPQPEEEAPVLAPCSMIMPVRGVCSCQHLQRSLGHRGACSCTLRAHVSRRGGQAVLQGGPALGTALRDRCSGGVLWPSGPPEKIQALPRLTSGTEFTMKIFCLTLVFEHALSTHHLLQLVFFLKDLRLFQSNFKAAAWQ